MRVQGITHRSDAAGVATAREQGAWRVGAYWITTEAPPRVVSALTKGVKPTCMDAASVHGLWVPLHTGEHVFRPRRGARPQDRSDPARADDQIFHGPMVRSWPDADPVPDLELVLRHAARCLPTVEAAILIESARNTGALTRSGLQNLFSQLSVKQRAALARVRADAESGTETAVRWWLESLNVRVRPQVWVKDVGRVDLLVGSSWVIECDSRRHHTAEENYQADRARDLRLRARGFTVTRLTWEQVFLSGEETKEFLLAILRRRQHRHAVTP